MSNNKRKRPQAVKVRNRAMNDGMRELRQGSRTTPVPSGTTYDRNKARKHRGRGWSEE